MRKRNVSTEFVAVLARMLTRHGNRVGALLYGTGVDTVIPARGGRRHVLHILHRMLQPAAARAVGGDATCSDLLRAAFPAISRRSHRVRRLRFHQRAAAGTSRSRSSRSATRCSPCACYDPLENELPDLGLLTMQDAETGEQLFVDTHDRGFRKRFARRPPSARAAAARALSCGRAWTRSSCPPTTTSSDAILRFADMRKRRSRLAAGGVLPAHLRQHRLTTDA